MFPRLNNLLAVLIPALIFVSCGFVDLRPIGISTVPAEPWSLLPETESPVIITFDTEMEKSSVERVFQISSAIGTAEGRLCWEENSLYIVPTIPWKPGIEYSLKLSGTITARDGREHPVSRDIPFYAVSRAPLPYIQSYYPSDNDSVGVSGEISGGTAFQKILEIDFSHSMDRRSTEDALKIDIPGEKIYEWLFDDKTLRVNSDKPLNPWTVYSWSVSEKALSRDGAPLAKEAAGRFITDMDRDFIEVVRLVPLMPPLPGEVSSASHPVWGAWFPAGTSLEQGPGHGHGIGVEFSKAAEDDSLRRAFSFTPSLPGRVEILSPVSAVYIPSKDPEPEVVYTLRISGALRDTEGLKMGDDYTVTFTPDIPFLGVNSISFYQNEKETEGLIFYQPQPGGLFPAFVFTGGVIKISIQFSLPFDTPQAREECVFKISFLPFFPHTLPPVSLRSALWFGDRLVLEWEGPEKSETEEPHFYKLFIPGGAGGAHNGRGSYLKEDLFFYLEAE